MSTMALGEGPDGLVSAWDTKGQIYFARIKSGTTDFTQPQSVPGSGKSRKHPALAVRTNGSMLLAWTEGTRWRKGGALAWQVFDGKGKPTNERGKIGRGVPVWGLPAVVATDDGFLILH